MCAACGARCLATAVCGTCVECVKGTPGGGAAAHNGACAACKECIADAEASESGRCAGCKVVRAELHQCQDCPAGPKCTTCYNDMSTKLTKRELKEYVSRKWTGDA